jgi:hypothetical protein
VLRVDASSYKLEVFFCSKCLYATCCALHALSCAVQ